MILLLAGAKLKTTCSDALSIMLIASQNARGAINPEIIPRSHAPIRAGLKSRDFYPRAAKSRRRDRRIINYKSIIALR